MALGFILGWAAHLLWERWRKWERGVDLEPILSIRDGRASIWPLPPEPWRRMHTAAYPEGVLDEVDPPDPRTTNLRDYAERWSNPDDAA